MQHGIARPLTLVTALALAGSASAQLQLDRLTSDLPAGSNLGRSVALSGGRALAGAPYEDGERGAAYVFDELGSEWLETARLAASDAQPLGLFGIDVAIDGDRAVVGSGQDAAYVFELQGTSWVETAVLSVAEPAVSFGVDVDLDGDRIAVGAAFDDDAGANAGAVFVFELQAGSWVQTAKLTAADGQPGDQFGGAVALAGDRLAVGALGEDGAGASSGAAYVFDRVGGVWQEAQKLVASDAAENAGFGTSVGLDGDRIVVGAQAADLAGATSGAAYAFELSGGVWSEAAQLTPADLAAGDRLGFDVALAGDLALVGAYEDDDFGAASGTAYVFQRSGGAWTQTSKLEASGQSAGDWLGFAVAADAGRGVVGAPRDDVVVSGNGSAYVFDLTSVELFGCGVNPGGSLRHIGGPPAVGAVWTLGVANPLGTQPVGSGAFLVVSGAPLPTFPCGALLPDWGMAGPGALGELLVDLSSPNPLLVLGPELWLGPGTTAEFALGFPDVPSLAGTAFFFQALMRDPDGTLGVTLGLTEAMRATLLP
ncbi:MAG: hypothetical protein AAF682_12205 [Planctomycetota bacterium]